MDTRAVVLALCGLLCHQTTATADSGQAKQNVSWSWQAAEGTVLPCEDAVWVGHGLEDRRIYLGRVQYLGNLIPATIQPHNITHPAVFISDYKILSSNTYEVMCGEGAGWQIVQKANGEKPLPAAALPVGNLEDGTVLYACRIDAYRMVTVGVVYADTHRCTYPLATTIHTGFESVWDYPYYDILIQP